MYSFQDEQRGTKENISKLNESLLERSRHLSTNKSLSNEHRGNSRNEDFLKDLDLP